MYRKREKRQRDEAEGHTEQQLTCGKKTENQKKNSDSPFVRDNNAGGGFVGDSDAVGIQVSRYESEDSSGASCSGGIYSTFDDVSLKYFDFFFLSRGFPFPRKKTHLSLFLFLFFFFTRPETGLHPLASLRHPLRAQENHLRRPRDDDGGHRHLRGPLPR